MKIKNILTVLLVAIVSASCSPAVKDVPIETTIPASTQTQPPVPTQTFTVAPTHAPTSTPTPDGGRSGLLLSFNSATLWETGIGWKKDLDLVYLYDSISKKNQLLLEGYSCIGVSPDGKKVALRKTENGKTNLFTMDLAKPDQKVLLYEDVVNTNVLSDYSYWFPGSDWIGFIARKDGIPQIFVIHPDGSDLTQVTHSSVGAVQLEPVFHEGVFWGEGTENSRGQTNIKNSKWTKMDGTEIVIQNFITVSPAGKYLKRSMKPQNPDCLFCDYVLADPVTDETKEITLIKPDPESEFPKIQPLSNDQWLVQWRNKNGVANTIGYWIYSSEGKPLFSFADLPHDHAALPEAADNVDDYNIIFKNSSKLPVLPISPDGNFLLIKHEIRTFLKKNYVDREDVNFYLLNLSTFKIQPVSNLVFDRNSIMGPNQGYYWVELP